MRRDCAARDEKCAVSRSQNDFVRISRAEFSKYFSRENPCRRARFALLGRLRAHTRVLAHAVADAGKVPVLSVFFHVSDLWVYTRSAAPEQKRLYAAPSCCARPAPHTAFFPLKTRKFACRFLGNAYYDRMKRVNPRRAVNRNGDRSKEIESFHVRQRKKRIHRRLVMVDKPGGFLMRSGRFC